ncbi:MAG: hypothetical protein V1789_12000 [PVC group bacterium]
MTGIYVFGDGNGFHENIISGDCNGNDSADIGLFRETSGLWGARGVTRVYSGGSFDLAVPGDYTGNETRAPAAFRGSAGLWAIRGVTRSYFGASGEPPRNPITGCQLL